MENKIIIVLNEELPENILYPFNTIDFMKKNNKNLELYATVRLPYTINYIEYKKYGNDDDRYYCYEDYDEKNKSCRFHCEIKPQGNITGIYRLGLGSPFKIGDIFPIKDNKKILYKKKYKNE